MAMYTMQLKTYIEMFSQFEENLSINERIEIGRKHLFDFDYPFFDSYYKKQFETNIIRRFYTREIGFETEELFKFNLESWLNLNMPYFNQLFESERIKYDPLTNTEMRTGHEKLNDKDRKDERDLTQDSKTDGSSSSNASQRSTSDATTNEDKFNRELHSDNPDSRLQIQSGKGKGVIEYASDIDENSSENQIKTDSKGRSDTDSKDKTMSQSKVNQRDDFKSNTNESEHFMQRRHGKIGSESYAKLIQEYRSALLRVELQIHKEMQELFMLVY